MYLGIDLGTTNTVVSRSFVDSDGKLITEVVQMGQMYNDNWEKFSTLPSMVYFDDEDNIIVGREAKRQREWDTDNVVTNAKRFMGTQKKWNIDGVDYEAKDIAAIVLQHCKKTIEREGNMSYETVVITVPASFNPDQIADTLRAAKQAGFKEDQVIIKHEPTAALLSFIDAESKKSEDDKYIDFSETKRILVFDLGGGTCDTSVIDVQVSNGEFHFTEKGIGRYQELGGIDFDAKLATGLLNAYFEQERILSGDITESEKEELYLKLRIAAEAIKEKISGNIYTKLSTEDDVDVENIRVKHNIPGFYKGKPYRISLSKAEYDQYTNDLYVDKDVHYKKFEDMDKNKNIIGVIRKTLEDYDIKKSSIDYVFVTGGMSQFLTVKQKVQEYLGCEIIAPENPMEAVARGASIYQYYKVREDKDVGGSSGNSDISSTEHAQSEGIVDTMMLAEAILLDMNEGLPRVIIPKKTVVPYEGEIIDEFKTTSPSGVKLNIYAAENEYDSSMRIQKSLEKRFTYPVESGTPFDIKYKINENKAIDMKIQLHDTHSQVVDISIRSDLKIAEQQYKIMMEDDE